MNTYILVGRGTYMGGVLSGTVEFRKVFQAVNITAAVAEELDFLPFEWDLVEESWYGNEKFEELSEEEAEEFVKVEIKERAFAFWGINGQKYPEYCKKRGNYILEDLWRGLILQEVTPNGKLTIYPTGEEIDLSVGEVKNQEE